MMMNNNINNIYTLIEEFEGTEGIREFTIVHISFDIDKLKDTLKDKIKMDEYGLIKKNGIEIEGELYFSTKYNDGFVSYAISEHNLC